jgi:serine/threonine-protein kinase
MVDATGQDEVTIKVGAGDIGYAFSPPAVRIDSSTTVVWEWTGQGGAHNVASVEGSESDFDNGETVAEEGYTFEQSFDNTGIQLYECTPHSANGMLGAIEVVEA